MPVDTAAFEAATARIIKMINGGAADHMEGLLVEGYGSSKVIERHARLFAEANDLDVAMIFPVLLAAFSGATQGAFTAPLFTEDWTPNPVPLVFQFFGIAESGARKSTVIKEGKGPLEAAMTRGTMLRRAWCTDLGKKALAAAEAAAAAQVGGNTVVDGPVWDKVFAGGVCPSTLTDSGTPEGIRDKLVTHGGHRVLLTGESDILREVGGAYAKGAGGGTLGLFVRGWDQETISVDRTGNAHIHMPEASFPFLVFVQPNSFARYTAVTPEGYDEWTDKGVFGRAWLWQMPKPSIPTGFQFKAKAPSDKPTELMMARILTLQQMERLVERSNEYRSAKGIRQAWSATQGADQAIAEKYLPVPEREALELDGADGEAAFVAVQNMLLALRRALAEADATDHGISYQYHPLVSRFTDHVMRLSAMLSLADAPDTLTVDTAHITDVAVRLMPWLWSGWVEVMDLRRNLNAETVIADAMLSNKNFTPVGEDEAVLQALFALSQASGPAAEAGFLGTQVTDRARAILPRQKKQMPGISRVLRASLEKLADEGQMVARQIPVEAKTDAAGRKSAHFKLTAAAYAALQKK